MVAEVVAEEAVVPISDHWYEICLDFHATYLGYKPYVEWSIKRR